MGYTPQVGQDAGAALDVLRYVSCQGITGLTEITMLVIAILGVAQVISPAAVGWTTIGLAAGGMLTACSGSNLGVGGLRAANKVLPTIVVIVLGALGAGGILSAAQVGWGVIGTGLISGAIFTACFSSVGIIGAATPSGSY